MYEDMRSVPGIVADPLVWTEKVLQAKKQDIEVGKKSHHNYVNIKKLGFNVCVCVCLRCQFQDDNSNTQSENQLAKSMAFLQKSLCHSQNAHTHILRVHQHTPLSLFHLQTDT